MNAAVPVPKLSLHPQREVRLLVVGAAVHDVIHFVDELPVDGETAMVREVEHHPGGKGANQALAAALMDAQVKFLSAVGGDESAEFVLDPLRTAGVDVEQVVRISDAETSRCIISVDNRGRNRILACPGAYHRLTPEHIQAASEAFRWAEALLVQNELPQATVQAALDLALKLDLPVIFNAAPFKHSSSPPPKGLDVIIANEVEAAGLLGVEDYFAVPAESLAQRWEKSGANHVIVTKGEAGSEWYPRGLARRDYKALSGLEVVDTVGAGDTFCGVFAVLHREGLETGDAIALAHVAAGVSVTRKGAQAGLPTRPQLVEKVNLLNSVNVG